MNEHGYYLTSSGRKVSLVHLQVSRTWRGLMEGSPELVTELMRKNNFKAIVEEMREKFGVEKGALILDEGLPALPAYTWIVLFDGKAIHSNDGDWQSRLALCWFTEAIPGNLDVVIAEVVGKLIWEQVAEDYDASW